MEITLKPIIKKLFKDTFINSLIIMGIIAVAFSIFFSNQGRGKGTIIG